MASPILVAVFAVILGSCSLTQAYSRPAHLADTRLEEVKQGQLLNEKKWNPNFSPICAMWLGLGTFLVAPAYGYLGVHIYFIEKYSKINIAECEQVQNVDHRANCIKIIEEQTHQGRLTGLKAAASMSIGAIITGYNIMNNCFSK